MDICEYKMNILKTVFILYLYIIGIPTAHAQESCYESDVDCTVGGEPLTFLTKEDIHGQESQSWMTMLWDQVSYLKNSIIGPSLTVPPEKSNAVREEDYATMLGVDDDLIMKYAQNLASSFLKGDQLKAFNDIAASVLQENEDIIDGDDKNNFEYPPVEKIKPHAVDHVQYRELEDGIQTKLITRSMNPALFEIPNFLSPSECDHIIEKSEEKGLFESTMFQSKNRTENGSNKGIERISYSSFLTGKDIDRTFLNKLHERIARLLDIPKQVVQWSEHLTIGMYKQGGHYYAHLDSNEASRNTPCCFQKICLDSNLNEKDNTDCCRMCRYATLLYYLNDVEEGGETAFPMADLTMGEMFEKEPTSWKNLSSNCHDASVVIKPEKGKAILWFNHYIDKNGYLDNIDRRSIHGGCDVIKGQKWIATNWISTPSYRYRYVKSKYQEKFNDYMGIEEPEQDHNQHVNNDNEDIEL